MDPTGLGVLVVGLVLCLAGGRSVDLALLASGFAVGWLLTEPYDASFGTAVLVGVAVAAGSWLLARVVFKVALLAIGGLAGAVVGAKIFGLLQPVDRSVLLVLLFVAATAVIGALVTRRFRRTAPAAVCALAGAALTLSGLARTFPAALDFLRQPLPGWQVAVTAVVWVVLAAAGWAVQRRPRRPVRARGA
ncbi:hypothetical protein WIS52_18830 [Pseudonocardia nematodicida]|uniref:DUF4203 domain-containing protein n=1 Tax=Pseudonocardia nematodicida TaxID=1206997 RepID=A0ABV1KDJ8_9PSEU